MVDKQEIRTQKLRRHFEMFRGCSKETRQTQGRIGCNAALAVHDLVDPAGWNADYCHQTVLGYRKRPVEI